MSLKNMRRDLELVTHAIHAVFVYAACTKDGYVKVGISRTPFDRVYEVHCNSPSPVRAVQWVWVGNLNLGRRIEKEVRKAWDARHTRGEWYRFDYAKPEDKRDFHDTLTAIVAKHIKEKPNWERLGPQQVKELIQAGNRVSRDKGEKKPLPTQVHKRAA